MNVTEAVKNYIKKMKKDVSGMKVLLLDSETTPIISTVFTQSELLADEVYLVDLITSKRERVANLKCIVFVRPTSSSINAIKAELRNPAYDEYYLYFSNVLSQSALENIAASDMHEHVKEVKEYFADYIAVNDNFFELGLNTTQMGDNWDPDTLERVTEGVTSILLSLKKKPLIQYEVNSKLASKLAAEIEHSISNQGQLYDFRKSDTAPILLLMDRRNDPVTPLLSPWTYQAMVHELLTITNGRVEINDSIVKEIVLSQEHDPFFRSNMFLNFGDIGINIKQYVNEYGDRHNSTKQVETLAEMKKFVEQYPEFQKLSGNVSKHVALISELGRKVEKNRLLQYGELEQSLAMHNNSSDAEEIDKLLDDASVSVNYKIRMVMLYALRYEKTAHNMITEFARKLKLLGASDAEILQIDALISFAGADSRMDPVSNVDKFIESTKTIFKGLKGVENVYTQHTPRLVQILQNAIEGKLKTEHFPFYKNATKDRPQDIIVFMIGGVTYAEAMHISKLTQSNPGVRIIIGGTMIHNSELFIKSFTNPVNKHKVKALGLDNQNVRKTTML